MPQNLKNKKIVILLASDFSHDSRVLKEAKSAQKAGMRVTLLARKSFDTKFSESRDDFKIKRFQTWIDWIWSKTSANKGREIAGSQSAGTHIPGFLVTYTSILNLWFLNRLFVRACLQIKPDVIHANDSITLPAAYALKKRGFKVIFDAHEFYSESVANPRYLWKQYYIYLERRLPRLNGIFSVCQSILDELDRRYQTDQLPQSILYNTPPYRKFAAKKVARPLRLLYLGNLQGTRDFSKLFSAIEKCRGVLLTNIGPGWQNRRTGNIISLGAVPPSEVIETASKYDVGIIPYIGDNLNNRYSTPNKLFEYMMAGLAIAASDLPEIKRVVTRAQNGMLFSADQSASIREVITSLTKNPQKILQFKRNSLKWAKDYCWENQEKKQIDLYEKVIGSI
ncbi:MAG: glycosyltransferase [Patescibacteria group bacterium]|jgi:glycosyltransferase involved in cell wall biosynthesis